MKKYYANTTIFGIDRKTGYENKILIGEEIQIISENEDFIFISSTELVDSKNSPIVISTSKQVFKESTTLAEKSKKYS
jgi:hypothetical protein